MVNVCFGNLANRGFACDMVTQNFPCGYVVEAVFFNQFFTLGAFPAPRGTENNYVHFVLYLNCCCGSLNSFIEVGMTSVCHLPISSPYDTEKVPAVRHRVNRGEYDNRPDLFRPLSAGGISGL